MKITDQFSRGVRIRYLTLTHDTEADPSTRSRRFLEESTNRKRRRRPAEWSTMNANARTMERLGAASFRVTQSEQSPGWNAWPATFKELSLSYYRRGFPPADQQYALAGLARYAQLWNDQHGHKEIPPMILDEAAAAEVRYHHYRGREFRRPCAALSACWTAIICDRPERIFTRWERMQSAQKRKKNAPQQFSQGAIEKTV